MTGYYKLSKQASDHLYSIYAPHKDNSSISNFITNYIIFGEFKQVGYLKYSHNKIVFVYKFPTHPNISNALTEKLAQLYPTLRYSTYAPMHCVLEAIGTQTLVLANPINIVKVRNYCGY